MILDTSALNYVWCLCYVVSVVSPAQLWALIMLTLPLLVINDHWILTLPLPRLNINDCIFLYSTAIQLPPSQWLLVDSNSGKAWPAPRQNIIKSREPGREVNYRRVERGQWLQVGKPGHCCAVQRGLAESLWKTTFIKIEKWSQALVLMGHVARYKVQYFTYILDKTKTCGLPYESLLALCWWSIYQLNVTKWNKKQ